jgi:hypothetical protein
MIPERWRHIEELYYAVLEIAGPERGVFLAQACGADEDPRREAESLLTARKSQSGQRLRRISLGL